MPSKKFFQVYFITIVVSLTVWLMPSVSPVRAANITVAAGVVAIAADGQCSLIEAIENANNDASTHADCTAGSGNDVITLSLGTYLLTTTHNNTDGNNGLPSVINSGSLTINGNSSIIQRSGGDAFRIFHNAAGATLTLNELTITGGGLATTPAEGNALYNRGTLILRNSTIQGNIGGGFDSRGGAIYNSGGSLTVEFTTISGNTATNGGGIYNNEGTVIMRNSTVSGNTATSQGGGILNISQDGADSTVSLFNVTVTNNGAATDGAGILNFDLLGTATNVRVSFKNSIIADNITAADCKNKTATVSEIFDSTAGHNLDSDGSCFAGSGTYLTGTPRQTASPNLGSLQINLPSPISVATHALLSGSPAIDSGRCDFSLDQRGQSRPDTVSSFCDMGAYESGLVGQTDVTISKSVQPAMPVVPGETITYTLSYTNQGFAGATGVLINDTIPLTVTGISFNSSGPSITDTTITPSYVWTVTDLSPGDSGTITVIGQVSSTLSSDTIFNNQATIATTSVDTNTVNNSSSLVPVNVDVPQLSAVDGSAAEEAGSLVFTITLNPASVFEVTVNYSTTNNTASLADYTNVSNTLTIPAGNTSGTIAVPLTSDPLDENDETFTLNLGQANNAGILDGTATGTIVDDDDPPDITINNPVVDESNGLITFTVSLSAASSFPVAVNYTTLGITATAGNDFTAKSGTLNIPAGDSSGLITVTILEDALDEDDELFALNLSGATNATILDNQGLGQITDNDPLPTLTIADVTDNEAVGSMAFTVTLSPVSGRAVTVVYSTTNGTATDGSDFTGANNTLTIPAGTTTAFISINIINDASFEAAEMLNVNLSSPTNVILGDTQAVGSITDNDPPPTISVIGNTVNEAAGTMPITISLSAVSNFDVLLSYSSTNGTATEGLDYTGVTNNVTISAGNLNHVVTVPILEDTLDELDETFIITLSNIFSATPGITQATNTIVDNDASTNITINDPTAVSEAAGQIDFTVSLSAASSFPITVSYTTQDDTAVDTQDYVAQNGTLVFPAGSISQTITIVITDDALFEATETFRVNLSGAVNGTISDNQGLGRITNNDAAPVITITNQTAAEDVGSMIFVVSLSNPSGSEVTFDYQTQNGTASAPNDYTNHPLTPVTIGVGNISHTITVVISDDTIYETAETFTVQLSNLSGATFGSDTGLGMINDNDPEPKISLVGGSVAENAGPLPFTVTLSNLSSFPVTMTYTTQNGTALDSTDYVTQSGTLVIPAGSLSQLISVVITDDTIFETTESLAVLLSNPLNATFVNSSASGSIVDNETLPGIIISDATANEGDGTMTFTVSLTASSSFPVSVTYVSSDTTATAGADYGATSGSLNFPAGVTSQQITTTIFEDTLFEGLESFLITLSGPVSATLTNNTASGSIIDNDPWPTLTISDTTKAENNGPLIFTITLNVSSAVTATVDYNTANGTATATGDYVATSGRLTFTPGITQLTISVPITDDTLFEAAETLLINLTNAVSLTIGDNQASGTINNDDPLPQISLSDTSALESAGTLAFTISLNTASGLPVTVAYSTTNGTATAGSDYTAASGSWVIPAGAVSSTLSIAIANDIFDELDETMMLTIANSISGTITGGTATGTIIDDDLPPTVSIDNQSQLESITSMTFTVSLSQASNLPITVSYTTQDNTAIDTQDYTAQAGTLIFPPGSISQTIIIPIINDTLEEGSESFTVSLTSILSGTAGITAGVGSITDDDTNPNILLSEATLLENAGTIYFTVTLTAVVSVDVGVDFATSSNTALAGTDFVNSSGRLTIPSGSLVGTIGVPVIDDLIDEADERFTMTLSNPANGILTDPTASGTILDDDPPPDIWIEDSTELETIGSMPFTVRLNVSSSFTVSVDYASAHLTTDNNDYVAASGVISIPPGDLTAQLTVAITDDVINETNETFEITLSNPISAVITDAVGIGTIIDNDSPDIGINDVTVDEGAGTLDFTVGLTAASSFPVTITFTTNGNTAQPPGDYTTTSGNLVIAPGVTSQTLTVPVIDDLLDENDETLRLDLLSTSSGTITDNQGIGTIIDNDDPPDVGVTDTTANEGAGAITFTVNLTAPSSFPITVSYQTGDLTANSTADYTGTVASQLVIPAGNGSGIIVIGVTDDTIDELDETFALTLTGVLSGGVITDNLAIGTIVDNELGPTILISDVTAAETAGSFDFTVNLTAVSSLDVGVNFTTVDGTALNSSDYVTQSGVLTIPAGNLSGTITVVITDDLLNELSEVFTVSLTNPVNGVLGDTAGLGTITDNDPQPTLTINNEATLEHSGSLTFTLNLDAPSGLEVTVDFATSDNTAQQVSDYVATSGSVVIPAGDTSLTFTITITDDTIDETDERFTITLSSLVNAVWGNNSASGTILNDEADPWVTIDDPAVSETMGLITFTVSLSAPSSFPITVSYTTQDNTAFSDSDYVAQAGNLNFTAGMTQSSITVVITDDAIQETTETFSLTLLSADNATLSKTVGVGTIWDNDSPPGVIINDALANEGDGTITFTVNLTALTSFPVTVTYTTQDGTALSTTDYVAQTGQLVIPAGTMTGNITVVITDDTLYELTEELTVTLTGAISGTIVDNAASGQITENDLPPALSLSGATTNEASGVITFTVTLSAVSSLPATVDYDTTPATALAGLDYVTTNGTLTIPAGSTSGQITVTVINDTLLELSERFTLTVSNPVSSSLLISQAAGTITDDDPPPTLSIDDPTADEGAGTMTFVISLSTVSGLPAQVNYTTQDGTAVQPNDYVYQAGTITLPAGAISHTLSITIVEDLLDENDETFTVTLSSTISSTIADGTGIGTITDNEGPPAISISDGVANEGAGQMIVTVSLNTLTSFPVTVYYSTQDGTAIAPADYTAVPSTALTIPAGALSQTLTIALIDDALDELTETLTITLSNPISATLADATGLGEITDNDNPPAISINDVTEAENAGTLTFTVELSGPSGLEVTVDFTTQDETAVQPNDYVYRTGSITFATGTTSQVITVTIVDDSLDEPAETVQLNLSNPVNGTISDSLGIGTITDNDDPPQLSIANSNLDESGGVMPFTITLNTASSFTITVDYASTDNTATAGTDYEAVPLSTLVLAPGSISATIGVTITDDILNEPNETFTITLSSPVSATLATANGSGTITDNDGPPQLTINDPIANEGDGSLIFVVNLSNFSSFPITVSYTTADLTATLGSDYDLATGVLTIPVGSLSGTITVGLVDDLTQELTETLALSLTAAGNATIADGQGIGTIIDDDPTPNLSLNDRVVAEGTPTAVFEVKLTSPSGLPVTVNYSTTNHTAIGGADYGAVSNTLIIPAGSITGLITIAIVDDALDEIPETFRVILSNPVNATIADAQGEGTINDDDPAPTAWVEDAIADEGAGTMQFVVRLSAVRGMDFTPSYSTTNDSALAGLDYQGANSGFLIPAGNISGTIIVNINEDTLYEKNEFFNLTLSVLDTVVFTDPLAVGTIIDNEPPPGLMIDDALVNEAAGTMTFTVRLTAVSGLPVTAAYTLTDNTATQGLDYTGANGTLVIPAGVTSTTITVNILEDPTDEVNETFQVTLGSPANANLVDGQAVGTITDNDAEPEITIANASANESAGQINFTVSLSAASSFPITISYTTGDITATAGSDYGGIGAGTLVIPPGQPSGLITTTIIDNFIDEDLETFALTLTGAISGTLVDNQAIGSIIDNDTAAVIVAPTSGLSTNEYGTRAYFTIRLNSEPTATVTVTVESLNLSEGVVGPTTLIFTPANWDSNQTITITGQTDFVYDAHVNYVVRVHPVTSLDNKYNGLDPADVSVVNNNVDPFNNPPTISSLGSQTTEENTPLTINFLIADDMTAPTFLALSSSSSNQTLVPNSRLIFGGSGNFRTLTIQPADYQIGETSIQVTVVDGGGKSSTAAFSLTVTPKPDPPLITRPITEQITLEDEPFTFTLASDTFTDPDPGDLISITAQLSGTETLPPWLTFDPISQTFSGTPANGDVGSYVIQVTAIDSTGLSTTTTFSLTILNVNDAPVVSQPLPDRMVDEDEFFNLEISPATFSDVDGGEVLTYTARLTDGSPLPAWLIFDPANLTFSGLAANEEVGDYGVEIIATDLSSATVSSAFTLTVRNLNDPPRLINPLADQTIYQNDDWQLIVAGNTFTDPDKGEVLTYTATLSSGADLPTWLHFEADTLTFSGIPTNDDVGEWVIRLTATDLASASASDLFTVTVINVNDPPTLQDDLGETDLNQPIIIDVLANDFDIDPGDTITLTSLTQPNQGMAMIVGSKIIFTPTVDFIGLATFNYTATDDHGATGTATVNVVVAAGQCALNDEITIEEDVPTLIDVITNDYTEPGRSLNLIVVGTPLNGTTVISQNQALYQPNPNFNGLDRFEYVVSNGNCVDRGSVTVTVTAVNDPPVAQNDIATTAENVGIAINILANDFDIENDPLTVISVSQPTTGQASFNNSLIYFTPTVEFTGTVEFQYTISDGELTDMATVRVDVLPIDAPIAVDDVILVKANTPTLLDVLVNDRDPNNVPLLVQMVSPPGLGTVVISNERSAEGAINQILYTPPAGFLGDVQFDYTISNGNLTDIGLVTIKVVPNRPPVAVDDTITTTEQISTTIEVLANDTDPDDDPLIITLTSQPVNGQAVISGSTVIYTPEVGFHSTDSFIYIISDGSLTDTAQVMVTVEADTAPPSRLELLTPIAEVVTTTTRPEFDWTAGTDNSRIISYTLIITGPGSLPIGNRITVTESHYLPPVDLPAGVYQWTVIAEDVVGNVSLPVPAETFVIKPQPVIRRLYLPIVVK